MQCEFRTSASRMSMVLRSSSPLIWARLSHITYKAEVCIVHLKGWSVFPSWTMSPQGQARKQITQHHNVRQIHTITLQLLHPSLRFQDQHHLALQWQLDHPRPNSGWMLHRLYPQCIPVMITSFHNWAKNCSLYAVSCWASHSAKVRAAEQRENSWCLPDLTRTTKAQYFQSRKESGCPLGLRKESPGALRIQLTLTAYAYHILSVYMYMYIYIHIYIYIVILPVYSHLVKTRTQRNDFLLLGGLCEDSPRASSSKGSGGGELQQRQNLDAPGCWALAL
jgi:hypothetical protein